MSEAEIARLAAQVAANKQAIAVISGADWIVIIQTIGQIATGLFTAWIGLKIVQMKTAVRTINDKTTVVSDKIDETKNTIDETKLQVDESLQRLDGRLTDLLKKTKEAAFAEGMATMSKIAEERARELKVVTDKAEAEAKGVKTAGEKERRGKPDK
jgi:hypothetical protein